MSKSKTTRFTIDLAVDLAGAVSRAAAEADMTAEVLIILDAHDGDNPRCGSRVLEIAKFSKFSTSYFAGTGSRHKR